MPCEGVDTWGRCRIEDAPASFVCQTSGWSREVRSLGWGQEPFGQPPRMAVPSSSRTVWHHLQGGRCSAAVNLGAPRPGGCRGHGVAGSSAHRQLCCVTGLPSADCCPGVGEHTLCQRCSSRPRGRRDVRRPRVRRPSLAVHWSALPGTGFPSRLAKGDGAVLPADVGLTAVPSSTQQLPGVLRRAPRVQEQQSPRRGPQSLRRWVWAQVDRRRRRTCHASAVRPSRPLCSVA